MATDGPRIELTPVETASSSDQPVPERPRLRLHHLFTLTAVMAVMLAIGGPYRQHATDLETPRVMEVGAVALGILGTALASVAMTITAYGVAWRRQGLTFFNEPGHWLLVVIAAHQLLYVTLELFLRAASTIQDRPYGSYSIIGATVLVWLLPGLLVLALSIYIARWKCTEQRWSLVFYANAAAALVPILGDLFVLLFLERAVRAENPRRPRMHASSQRRGYVPPITASYGHRRSRDAAHWCGVVAQFVMSGVPVITMIGIVAWMVLSVLSM